MNWEPIIKEDYDKLWNLLEYVDDIPASSLSNEMNAEVSNMIYDNVRKLLKYIDMQNIVINDLKEDYQKLDKECTEMVIWIQQFEAALKKVKAGQENVEIELTEEEVAVISQPIPELLTSFPGIDKFQEMKKNLVGKNFMLYDKKDVDK